jgi:carbamate kinase
MVEDAGRGWRRVVPSPRPVDVVEAAVVRRLLDAGVVVVAAGGGGIPVLRRENRYDGVEAVIDKDLASAVLGLAVDANALIMSTSVDAVALGFGTPSQRWIPRMTAGEAERHLAAGEFPPGSMGPKVRAAIDFLERGGEFVAITSPPLISEAVAGRGGTRIVA